MANLALFTFDGYNKLQIAGAQAAAVQPIDVTVGSDTLALIEGNTSSLLYLQANITTLLSLTRAATSYGEDLDSFYEDFGFLRLPSVSASGTVTLMRNQANSTLVVPTDGSSYLLLADATQTYVIQPDAGQPGFDEANNQYVCPIGATTMQVTVVCTLDGTQGNIPVGTPMLLGTGTTGFDTAVATSGFTNGLEPEPDADFRTRFVLYLQSLARGTLAAIGSAIRNVQQGITYSIANNQDPEGNFEPGNFVVTIDDGSGNAPDSLIAAVDAAVSAYQADTISHNVRRPHIVQATAQMLVTLKTGTVANAVTPQIVAALNNYINTLPLSTPLSITKLSAIVYAVSNTVINVSNVLINGTEFDLLATEGQIIKAAANGVTVTTAVA